MASWYYADRGGEQRGPVDEAALRATYARGELTAESLVWRDGLAEWEPLARHAGALGITLGGASRPPGPSTPPPARASRPSAPASRPAISTPGGQRVVIRPPDRSRPVVIVFALLLLMVPVLGIVLAIAIPAYSDYTSRARIAEAFSRVSNLRLQVSEFRLVNDRCPTPDDPGFESLASYTDPALLTAVSIAVDGEGESARCLIDLEFAPGVVGSSSGRSFRFAFQPGGDWAHETDIDARYLPSRYRN